MVKFIFIYEKEMVFCLKKKNYWLLINVYLLFESFWYIILNFLEEKCYIN